MKKTCLMTLLLGIVLLYSGPAAAQCPPMQSMILIDQSSSMLDKGSTGQPKWQIGRDLALANYASLPSGTQVAITGFHGSTPYYFPTVKFSDNKRKGVDDGFLLGKIADTAASISGATPLAGAACDGLKELWTTNPTCTAVTRRNLYLYSDGLENSTPSGHVCHSLISSSTPFDASKAGTGFGLAAGSWQRKVANMAYNGNSALDFVPVPDNIRPVANVSVLFDFLNSLAATDDGRSVGAATQVNVDLNGIAFFKGLAKVSFGTYFEAKSVGGVAAKIPLPGDTNPQPASSCVDQVDLDRILAVFGRAVANNDPQFSGTELAARDVNNDLIIDINDYSLAIDNFGKCR